MAFNPNDPILWIAYFNPILNFAYTDYTDPSARSGNVMLLLLQFPPVGQLVFEMGPDVSIEGWSVVTFEAAYGAIFWRMHVVVIFRNDW